jgi:hypothetical protein
MLDRFPHRSIPMQCSNIAIQHSPQQFTALWLAKMASSNVLKGAALADPYQNDSKDASAYGAGMYSQAKGEHQVQA